MVQKERAATSHSIQSGHYTAYPSTNVSTAHRPRDTRQESSSFNTEEFLQGARERALGLLFAETLQQPTVVGAIHEIPYLLRSTRALIAMNASIWDRCQDHRSATLDGILPFSRVSIPRVKTQVDSLSTRTTTFRIETTVTSMDFGSLPPVPKELSNLFSVPMMLPSRTTNGQPLEFPDYASFLDRATLLRDEALVPFLVQLKDHLESVHVFLGTIEAWIMEPMGQVHFLEDVFDGISNVEIPKLADLLVPCGDCGGDLKSCTIRHSDSSICLRCHKPFSAHYRGMSRHAAITHLCDYHGRHVGSFLKPVDKTIEITYCHPCDSSSLGYYDACPSRMVNDDISMDSPSDMVRLEKILSQHHHHHRLDRRGNSDEDQRGNEMIMDDVSDSNFEARTLMAPVVEMTTLASEVY